MPIHDMDIPKACITYLQANASRFDGAIRRIFDILRDVPHGFSIIAVKDKFLCVGFKHTPPRFGMISFRQRIPFTLFMLFMLAFGGLFLCLRFLSCTLCRLALSCLRVFCLRLWCLFPALSFFRPGFFPACFGLCRCLLCLLCGKRHLYHIAESVPSAFVQRLLAEPAPEQRAIQNFSLLARVFLQEFRQPFAKSTFCLFALLRSGSLLCLFCLCRRYFFRRFLLA